MTDPIKLAHFVSKHKEDYEKRKRPLYTCDACGITNERKPGDFETATCTCGNTILVHFSE